jgi:hypothetical protein
MSSRLGVLAAAPALVITGLLALPLLLAGAPEPAKATGIPPRVLAAYKAVDRRCPGLRWQLLAGIGMAESVHGTSRGASADEQGGEVRPWIFGPPLNGQAGTVTLPIGRWLGWWGLTGPWQQAVGPMQFLPGTFTAWAVDGDGDRTASPHDLDDAVATAARYLCGRERRIDDERAALWRYNRSAAYADRVLDYASRIADPGWTPEGPWLCPVAGPVAFTDTWLAPRSGGRRHHGVDMFAFTGTPVVAPVAGRVEHYHDSLGGQSLRLWGDDGTYYYGTHLSAYGPISGHVAAGTVIGYVGQTGNAASTPPHLHFEIHPGRRPGGPSNPINPTPIVELHCAAGGGFVGRLSASSVSTG